MLSPTYINCYPYTWSPVIPLVWPETIFYFYNIVLDFGQKRFQESEKQTTVFLVKENLTNWDQEDDAWKKKQLWERRKKPRVLRCSWGHAWRNLKYGSYKACERYGQKKGKQTKRLFPNNIKDILGGTFIHLNAQKTSRKGLWKNYTSN